MNQDELRIDSHPRQSSFGTYIYPVLSRRSGGLSLGVNLNLDQHCSFACRYCQVDRSKPQAPHQPDAATILNEVKNFIEGEHSLSKEPIKDISIAGDGEPTEAACLPEVIEGLLEIQKQYGLDACKIVLFTNGTGIARPKLRPTLKQLTDAGGEIWFKLDFWNEESYHWINQGKISYKNLWAHLLDVGKEIPLVIQSCFFDGLKKFGQEELDQYIRLIQQATQEGVQVQKILAYSLARAPAEEICTPIEEQRMQWILDQLTVTLPIEIKVF